MKRSPELAILSREHHLALALALRMRRAGAEDVETVAADAVEFLRSEILEHFRLEEQLLLPALAGHTGADDPDIRRVEREHADLRHRFDNLIRDSSPAPVSLNELGQRLAAHIRFEERTLFVRVEAVLAPDELQALGHRLRAGADKPSRP